MPRAFSGFSSLVGVRLLPFLAAVIFGWSFSDSLTSTHFGYLVASRVKVAVFGRSFGSGGVTVIWLSLMVIDAFWISAFIDSKNFSASGGCGSSEKRMSSFSIFYVTCASVW